MQLSEEQRKSLLEQKEGWQAIINRAAIFQRVFSDVEGKKVLTALKIECGADARIFSKKNPDPYLLAYNAGKRDVWHFIQQCLEGDVEKAKKELDKLKKDAES